MIHALLNKRLRALCLLVVFFLSCAISSAPKDDALSVQGVVVAIQRGEKDARLIEPESFADMAEIYMVRADDWSPPARREKYILIEYVHRTDLSGTNNLTELTGISNSIHNHLKQIKSV